MKYKITYKINRTVVTEYAISEEAVKIFIDTLQKTSTVSNINVTVIDE